MSYDMLDGDDSQDLFSPVCTYCQHKHATIRRTCAAFPQRIPDEIWLGKNPHTDAYPGDYGIRFERRQPK